jgi:Eco57I restriction-modification methylase
LARSWNAWPRVLGLFRLVFHGSHHPDLTVPEYGGELFAPGDTASMAGVSKSLAVFESACFDRELMSDRDVFRLLERITRTRVKLRQGRSSTWMPAPVDFSDLSSEYIGILYEGLLDFELKTAPANDPVVFLAIGNQPALPLSRLEAMDNKALGNLLDKMKDTSSGDEEVEASAIDETSDEEEFAGDEDTEKIEEEADEKAGEDVGAVEDERHTTRTRAEEWALRAVEVGKLVKKPKAPVTPEKRLVYEEKISRKARQLVSRVVLPGEWYLVRWGGTRKGSGTFYTKPGLAVPTVHRTLRPLAYEPPTDKDGKPNRETPAGAWSPKKPEEILALKVCDPACGSGTFAVAALRYLTNALYEALHHHNRIREDGERAVVALISGDPGAEERLCEEMLPCRPDDALFEPRLKAVLRRHVVELCLYGVDLDPLAVELCRLALWVETMDRELPFSFLDHKIKCGNSLVGAWFDQFQHYPVMAWKNREGGDKNHTNGVHFKKEDRTKAIKAFVKDVLKPDLLSYFDSIVIFDAEAQLKAQKVHKEALATLSRLHDLPLHDSAERARVYREELVGSESYRSLKGAMDLWCACWFWQADALDQAPLPTTFAAPAAETLAVVEHIAASKRFFHWELEFPDVFNTTGSGFDAMLGNPPWDIAKPNSKEFFSNIDPLYRAYGKQEALRYQSEYFSEASIERQWIDYNADFRAQSNFMGCVASPYGDPEKNEKNQYRFSIKRGKANLVLHDRWRTARKKSFGFSDTNHPYRYQGSADINLYKISLELAHALLKKGGRLGFIVPSGLYSDHGTGALRRLFLDQCRWEWLFNFINWYDIFPSIYYRSKFNAIVVQKGGTTTTLNTAFVRTNLEDWERAEVFATPYSREQLERLSPRSKVILEIQSQRDLEILEKIYANSVLLGDEGPGGWGIQYAREFDMTNDSKLFPLRPKWEADGYRPDEYSRWLKGGWRPIGELWAELGVDSERPTPLSPEAEIALREADIIQIEHPVRCAQPPYNRLPIPRADIPEGVTLSREADEWIREEQVEDITLPLYEGRMIGQFDFSQKGWVSGTGRSANWRDIPWNSKQIEPQFMMSSKTYSKATDREGKSKALRGVKIGFMAIGSATNARTMIAGFVHDQPCGNAVPTMLPKKTALTPLLGMGLNSFGFDYAMRCRLVGLNLNYFIIAEAPLPRPSDLQIRHLIQLATGTSMASTIFADVWVSLTNNHYQWRSLWALSASTRARALAMSNAVFFSIFGYDLQAAHYALRHCDFSFQNSGNDQTPFLNPNGFWRVDKEIEPELRQTILALVAFHDLEEKIRDCDGDRKKGIEAFLNQNDGEGWMLPETLRLVDYGLGHDERAKAHQPVASRFGRRFYDWQLAQSPEESWRECHLHARNFLGQNGYLNLLAEVLRDTAPGSWRDALIYGCDLNKKENLLKVFTKAIRYLPPEVWHDRIDKARTVFVERGFTIDSADTIQMLVEALKRIPEETRTKGIGAARGLLDDADFNVALKRLLAFELKGSDHSWHVIAHEQLGGSGYRQLLDDLEPKNPEKVAESVTPYNASKGKITQMKLFD